MKEWAELIQAISALLWPILAFITVIMFRQDIRELLHRLKKGKLLGQELELDASLTSLQANSAIVVSELSPTSVADATKEDVLKQSRDTEKVLDVASRSPKAALMLLASEIEKQLRIFMAITGHHTMMTNESPAAIASYLGKRGWLTSAMVETLQGFREIRNKIVHGTEDVRTDHILRAIDSGMTILKALEAIPSEINIVYHPGVEVFADKDCRERIAEVKGLILETTSPGGTAKSHRIFPTMRTNYEKGRQVAWEWNMSRTWDNAWYRDPDTKEIKQAWGASAEFVGRHIEEL